MQQHVHGEDQWRRWAGAIIVRHELQTHQRIQDSGQPARRCPGSASQLPGGLRRLVQQVEQAVVQRRLQDQARGVAPDIFGFQEPKPWAVLLTTWRGGSGLPNQLIGSKWNN